MGILGKIKFKWGVVVQDMSIKQELFSWTLEVALYLE